MHATPSATISENCQPTFRSTITAKISAAKIYHNMYGNFSLQGYGLEAAAEVATQLVVPHKFCISYTSLHGN